MVFATFTATYPMSLSACIAGLHLVNETSSTGLVNLVLLQQST